jgi:SAF domain
MVLIVLHPSDTVAVCRRAVMAGERFLTPGGERLLAADAVPFGHKIALRPHAKGESVIKYGQPIGETTIAVAAGEHVHVHNLRIVRGRRARQRS